MLSSIVIVGLLAVPALSQEKTDPPKRPQVTGLRLQLVQSRYQGDRKISSRPYTIVLATQKQFSLRQGTEVPIPVTSFEKDGKEMTSFQYKNVGANMEFSAEALEGGRYLLSFAFEDSSIFAGEPALPRVSKDYDVPGFNTVGLRGAVVLRDGETAPFSATHAITGEVSKLEITLSVLK